MRGKPSFVEFARHRGGDNGRAVLVPDVVLHDENGAYAALLATDNGA